MDKCQLPGRECQQGIFNERKHQVEPNISSASPLEFLTILCGDPIAILAEVTTFDSVEPRRAKGFTLRL